jgi:hypothetical protein
MSKRIYYNPVYSQVYKVFADYFYNPTLTKISQKDTKSVYAIRIKCSLLNQYRYLVVTVPYDINPVGTTRKLETLEWESLQTRTFLKDPYSVSMHSYVPSSSGFMSEHITMTEQTDEYVVYSSVLPIKITILCAEKFKNYNKTGMLCNAIETFQTIISLC